MKEPEEPQEKTSKGFAGLSTKELFDRLLKGLEAQAQKYRDEHPNQVQPKETSKKI
ncbi:MAG TPA: hypothetical protein PLS25_07955 [Methanoregulaceae archaeon]|nr:hypothetical protein [Methanoregulaceae archaeon]